MINRPTVKLIWRRAKTKWSFKHNHQHRQGTKQHVRYNLAKFVWVQTLSIVLYCVLSLISLQFSRPTVHQNTLESDNKRRPIVLKRNSSRYRPPSPEPPDPNSEAKSVTIRRMQSNLLEWDKKLDDINAKKLKDGRARVYNVYYNMILVVVSRSSACALFVV